MVARTERLAPWPLKTSSGWPRPADPWSTGDTIPDFKARGACVPFETSALYASRVRADDRDGMSLLLRNFATSGSTYVLPWKSVPSTIAMSLRDRALHHEVGASRALTPRAVRAAVRVVAAAGLGGPEAQESAQASIAEDRQRAAELQAAVLVRALEACGFSRENVPLGKLDLGTTPEALRTAAGVLHMPPAKLFTTTEMIAQELLPVGLRPQSGETELDSAGPLRRLMAQLGAFSHHLRERLDAAPPESRSQYERAAAAAAATIVHTDRAFERIDRELSNMHRILTRWPQRQAFLREELDQVYWLLDGWEPTIEHYTQKLTDWLTLSQDRTMSILSTLMPPGANPARLALPPRL
jgi:hypothetical protein